MRGVKPWHQTPWDWRAAIQFICGGVGVGLLLLTALAALVSDQWLRIGGGAALIFLSIGLFSVWIKLGRRWRFLLVFRNPWTSWMSREALFSLPMMGLGIIGVLFAWPLVTLLAALFGVGYLYSQAQILKASQAIPAWREPLIVPLFVVTGLVEGTAVYVLLLVILGVSEMWLTAVFFLLLIGRFGLWLTYLRKLTTPGQAPEQTVAELTAANRLVTPIGHIVPLLMLIAAFFMPSGGIILGALAGLSTLFGGWYLKFIIIARAAYNQGFAIERTPARTPGYSGAGVKPGWDV